MKHLGIYIGSLVRDGAERVTICISDYFVRHGIKCTIFTKNIADNEYNLPLNVNRKNINGGGYLSYKKDIKKLRQMIIEEKIDTLLIMDLPACLYAIPATKKLKINVIVSERNDPKNFAGKKIVAFLSRYYMKKAKGFVFQTSEALNFYKGAFDNRSVVISNPIYKTSLPDPYSGVREKIVVSGGRLNPQKNQKMLLEAFRKFHTIFPEYKLIIYGEGILRGDLENYIEENKMEKFVKLPGNSSNYLNEINNASIFVLSSNFEGIPNVLLEAMALGLPCISTDCPCGGPRSLIKNGENGFLVRVNDVDMLVERMSFLAQNPQVCKKISLEAIKVRDEYDSEIICKKWFDFINKF